MSTRTTDQHDPTQLARIVWIRESLELGELNEALQAIAALEEDLADEREAA